MSEEVKKTKPYILTSNFTISLYIILIIVIIYYSSIVYQYDMEMNKLRHQQWNYISHNRNNLRLFRHLSEQDKELLKVYISHIVDKKKLENTKFDKITSAMKNGCVTGFLGSSLAGAPIQACILTGLTIGSTSALYKSIINYNKYKKLNIDQIIKNNNEKKLIENNI